MATHRRDPPGSRSCPASAVRMHNAGVHPSPQFFSFLSLPLLPALHSDRASLPILTSERCTLSYAAAPSSSWAVPRFGASSPQTEHCLSSMKPSGLPLATRLWPVVSESLLHIYLHFIFTGCQAVPSPSLSPILSVVQGTGDSGPPPRYVHTLPLSLTPSQWIPSFSDGETSLSGTKQFASSKWQNWNSKVRLVCYLLPLWPLLPHSSFCDGVFECIHDAIITNLLMSS